MAIALFRLADFVGLDVELVVLEHLYEVFGGKFKLYPILVDKVKNGHRNKNQKRILRILDQT